MTAGPDQAAWDRFVTHSVQTSMFFPTTRLFVAGNPKSAGTTLRWWLLAAHGVEVEAVTAGSLWGESSPAQTVWDGGCDLRYTWNRLSDEERGDALESADVLTVLPVRHPVTRAFSAWAGKYLTAEPYYEQRLPAPFPRLPDRLGSPDDVRDQFTRFVQALSDHVEAHPDWDDVDVHFWPQHRLLGRAPAGTTLTLRQEAVADGLQQITAHLQQRGLDPGPAARLNENVVGYRPDLVDDSAAARLAELYAADFARWGYDPAPPASSAAEPDLDWLNDVRGRNRRYAVLHRAAVGGRRRTAELAAELVTARQREEELLASSSWRVTRPLRWLSEAVRRG